jgi:protein-tyrosine phosphatase
MADHDRVTDLLWVGGRLTAEAWAQLYALGVRVVINLQEEERDDFGNLRPVAELWLPARDMEMPSLEQMWLACAVIDGAVRQGLGVLVHCRYGVGRSPMTLAAYVVTQGMEPREAVRFVAERRTATDPNRHQWEHFLAFADRWRRGGFAALGEAEEAQPR